MLDQAQRAGRLAAVQQLQATDPVAYGALIGKFKSEVPPPGRGRPTKSFDWEKALLEVVSEQGVKQSVLRDAKMMAEADFVEFFASKKAPSWLRSIAAFGLVHQCQQCLPLQVPYH